MWQLVQTPQQIFEWFLIWSKELNPYLAQSIKKKITYINNDAY